MIRSTIATTLLAFSVMCGGVPSDAYGSAHETVLLVKKQILSAFEQRGGSINVESSLDLRILKVDDARAFVPSYSDPGYIGNFGFARGAIEKRIKQKKATEAEADIILEHINEIFKNQCYHTANLINSRIALAICQNGTVVGKVDIYELPDPESFQSTDDERKYKDCKDASSSLSCDIFVCKEFNKQGIFTKLLQFGREHGRTLLGGIGVMGTLHEEQHVLVEGKCSFVAQRVTFRWGVRDVC